MLIKLSKWAKLNGITYRTAWNWYTSGKFPVKTVQLSTGTILAEDNSIVNSNIENKCIVDIYSRVSSSNKKLDLQTQADLCEQYCLSNGFQIRKIYKEVASGMNDNRKMLNEIIKNPPNKLIVLYKDRLTRFGFNYLKELFSSKNCELVVINQDKTEEDDLMKDLIAIITSFCCRLYGARRGQHKVLNIKKELKSN